MPDLDARFRCPVFSCDLSVKACLLRHTKVWPNGGRRGGRAIQPCGSCRVGAALLASTPSFVPPPPSQPPVVLPVAQRRAKARWQCVHLDDGPARELSPWREAALASPDDDGIEPDL